MPERTPLDDIEFLARSPHRVDILEALKAGPWIRSDLHQETGISQPTLGRALSSLQDRGWVAQEGREYALTSVGELVAEEFDSTLGSFEFFQRLAGFIELLPTDLIDFDIQEFRGADIVTPVDGDPFRHVRRVEELVYRASHLRLLTNVLAPGSPEDHANRAEDFLESDRVVESVIAASTIDQTLSDPGLREWLTEFVALDRARLYRYEGTVPLTAGIADDTTLLAPTDADDVPVALIETNNEIIREWVEKTINEYMEKSTELTVDSLSSE